MTNTTEREQIVALFDWLEDPTAGAIIAGDRAMSKAWSENGGRALRGKIIPAVWRAMLAEMRREALHLKESPHG